jgi:hypothetical protein
MGMEEAQKLLQPLQEAYRDTDFSLVWSEWIMIEWVGDIVVVEVVDAT